MRRYFPTLVAACLALSGCAHERQGFAFPHLDDLSEEAKTECPEVEQVTGELGNLALKDANLAVEYAACRKRHRAARDAYLTAQRLLAEAAAKAEAQHKGKSK